MTRSTRAPAEHFQLNVVPNYERYRQNPASELDAMNAVYAIAHLVDWTYWYFAEHDATRLAGCTTDSGFRQHLLSLNRDLRAVSDLADASKHRFLVRSLARRIEISSTAAFDPNGFILDGRDLETVTAGAMAFWLRWLGVG